MASRLFKSFPVSALLGAFGGISGNQKQNEFFLSIDKNFVAHKNPAPSYSRFPVSENKKSLKKPFLKRDNFHPEKIAAIMKFHF